MFRKKGVLTNFAKFTEKHLYQRLFFNEVAGLRQLFFVEIPLVAASGFKRTLLKVCNTVKEKELNFCNKHLSSIKIPSSMNVQLKSESTAEKC